MINYADKAAKSPSFSTSKLVRIIFEYQSARTRLLTDACSDGGGYPGAEHPPDALPRAPGRVADPERALPPPRVLQDDQPADRPGHA